MKIPDENLFHVTFIPGCDFAASFDADHGCFVTVHQITGDLAPKNRGFRQTPSNFATIGERSPGYRTPRNHSRNVIHHHRIFVRKPWGWTTRFGCRLSSVSRKIRIAQQLSGRQRGFPVSTNLRRAIQQLARLHAKVAWQRKDFLHQTSAWLVKQSGKRSLRGVTCSRDENAALVLLRWLEMRLAGESGSGREPSEV